MRARIKEIVDANKDAIVKLAQELIRIKSHSGEEKEIVHFIAKKLDELGFEEIWIDEMGNVIGRIGSGKKKIVIDGHVDTVAIGRLRYWKFNPLGGDIYSGSIYGRGSCDQKGGIASALIALRLLREIGIPKNITVFFVGSIQEEPYEGANWQYILTQSK